MDVRSPYFTISCAEPGEALWSYRLPGGPVLRVAPPSFPVDGSSVTASPAAWELAAAPAGLANGCVEHRWRGPLCGDPDLALEFVLRVAADSPVVRFRYLLHSLSGRRLARAAGQGPLCYLGFSLPGSCSVREVGLSQFFEDVHSYCLTEQLIPERAISEGASVMGPLLAVGAADHAALVAYEHGSQAPDRFLEFLIGQDRRVALRAVKGNYPDGQPITPGQPFATVWFQLAMVPGDVDALACAYRDWVLRRMSMFAASRKPYIYYNTWGYQERRRHWQGGRYLDPMRQERVLAEIRVAKRLGVDVFVLDTGWYERTGDWRVNRSRFPDGLAAVRDLLAQNGMRLGLWFSPTEAALTSEIRARHPECIASREGRPFAPAPIWETEPSQRMCLVSAYRHSLAEEMVRLVEEVGVSYFKWDAVDQYGCDSPDHDHGHAGNSAEERRQCHAYRLPLAMAEVVERIGEACPQAIVDFDVTEAGRCLGLGFLGAGKYFLVNNGPYFRNFDLPANPLPWNNVFVHPGPARALVCRAPLGYDRWIPSTCFLTHYLPDEPAASQVLNVASLILGQNGIWGDLLAVPEEGIARIARMLELYKQVRDDITAAPRVRPGAAGGSPEIHEKIDPRTGRGAVAIFSAASHGEYVYVTERPVRPGVWHTEGTSVAPAAAGRARLTIACREPGAQLVFFGVREA